MGVLGVEAGFGSLFIFCFVVLVCCVLVGQAVLLVIDFYSGDLYNFWAGKKLKDIIVAIFVGVEGGGCVNMLVGCDKYFYCLFCQVVGWVFGLKGISGGNYWVYFWCGVIGIV